MRVPPPARNMPVHFVVLSLRKVLPAPYPYEAGAMHTLCLEGRSWTPTHWEGGGLIYSLLEPQNAASGSAGNSARAFSARRNSAGLHHLPAGVGYLWPVVLGRPHYRKLAGTCLILAASVTLPFGDPFGVRDGHSETCETKMFFKEPTATPTMRRTRAPMQRKNRRRR
jgi:hypothetical protein